MDAVRRTTRRAGVGRGATICLFAILACAFTSRAQTGPVAAAPLPPSQKESLSLGQPGANAKAIRPVSPIKSADGAKGLFGQTVLPLLGVLALVVGAGAALRGIARRHGGLRATIGAGGRSPAGIIEVLGRYPVGRGVTLVLLKVDSRVLLLSQSAGGRFGAGASFSTLSEIREPEEVASILTRARDIEGDSLAERFRSMLGRFDRQMDSGTSQPAVTVPASNALWDGSRSDIPIIDLTRRESGRAGTLRKRITQVRTQKEGRG